MSVSAWQPVVVVFAVFILGRVAFFQYRIWYLKRMRPRWVATVCDSEDAPQLSNEDMPQLKRALLEAHVGIEDIVWPVTEPAGYGFVAQRQMSLINNLCSRNEEMAQTASAKWGEAIGAYRLKRNDTLNPVRWLIAAWHLPKVMASSVGADSEAWPVKVVQIVYQAGVVVGLAIKAWQQWSGVLR